MQEARSEKLKFFSFVLAPLYPQVRVLLIPRVRKYKSKNSSWKGINHVPHHESRCYAQRLSGTDPGNMDDDFFDILLAHKHPGEKISKGGGYGLAFIDGHVTQSSRVFEGLSFSTNYTFDNDL